MSTFLQPVSPVMGTNETPSSVTLANTVTLGTQWADGAGNQYVYVYNASNSQLSQGQFVVLATNVSGYSVTITNATSVDIGVGVIRNATMATAAYGWAMYRGFSGVSTDSASFVTNQCMLLGANGNFGAVTSTIASFVTSVIVGKALCPIPTQTTCSTAANLNAAWINFA